MGLNMYLTARKYVGGWKHGEQGERKLYASLADLVGIKPHEGSPHFYIEACVGYWRKANAVHRWFVEKVQGGRDECQGSPVSREQLGELRAACLLVLDSVETVDGNVSTGTTYYPGGKVEHNTRPGRVVAQPGVAAAVLPTQGGSFFGKTDYDDDYITDLRETAALIDRVLGNPALADCEFEYRASW